MKEPVKKAQATADVGLTDEKIQAWKKQWGKIFKTTTSDGEVFIWRKLRRREYTALMSASVDASELESVEDRIYLRQENIAKAVTLYPDNVEALIDESAGLATTIADAVIVKSGFEEVDTEEI